MNNIVVNDKVKAEVRTYLLSALDALEKYCKETETVWDDMIAIPAIIFLRARVQKDV